MMRAARTVATRPLRHGAAASVPKTSPPIQARATPRKSSVNPKARASDQRNGAGWQRPLGAFFAIDIDIEDVVQNDASRVEQGGSSGEAGKRFHRSEIVPHEEEAHRHVGQGREDVGQAHQAEPGEELRRRLALAQFWFRVVVFVEFWAR